MNQDTLMNIRNNIINGNRRDAYNDIKNYGFPVFPIDYLEYLRIIGLNEELSLDELREALYLMKYHFNRSI